MEKENTFRKLKLSLATIIILCICLMVTSFALGILASKYLRDNQFTTGDLDIEIIQKNSINIVDSIEPGMTINKRFTIKNNSEIPVYYKVYFENVDGDLKDSIEVKLIENTTGEVLYDGLAKDFVQTNPEVKSGEKILEQGSEEMTLKFYLPEISKNKCLGDELLFDITATAVQAKNNPNKEFE